MGHRDRSSIPEHFGTHVRCCVFKVRPSNGEGATYRGTAAGRRYRTKRIASRDRHKRRGTSTSLRASSSSTCKLVGLACRPRLGQSLRSTIHCPVAAVIGLSPQTPGSREQATSTMGASCSAETQEYKLPNVYQVRAHAMPCHACACASVERYRRIHHPGLTARDHRDTPLAHTRARATDRAPSSRPRRASSSNRRAARTCWTAIWPSWAWTMLCMCIHQTARSGARCCRRCQRRSGAPATT